MKKNAFLTFMFSVIPGCGLMYLGYMKKGLQTMAMFVASCYVAGVCLSSRSSQYFEWIYIFFLLLLPVIWFYQMFDSMHALSRMRRLEIEVPMDDSFFIPFMQIKHNTFSPSQNPLIAKIIAAILIIGGSYGLLSGLLDYMYKTVKPSIVKYVINPLREYSIPAIVSLVLIIIGVRLLMGSKPIDTDNSYDNNEDEGGY